MARRKYLTQEEFTKFKENDFAHLVRSQRWLNTKLTFILAFLGLILAFLGVGLFI